MNRITLLSVTGLLLAFLLLLSGCENFTGTHDHGHGHDTHAEEEVSKGPHGGRLLKQDDLVLELAIFEAGMPAEYRVWITDAGQAVKPAEVKLVVSLHRLGGKKDLIHFYPQQDYLRGDQEIYEPHSFVVSVEAAYRGRSYRWQYESFEGRTTIAAPMAAAFGLQTALAGPQTLKETITVYGRIEAAPNSIRNVSARFAGELTHVYVSQGQAVKKGQLLARIESNESLSRYAMRAPISGVITRRYAGAGEQTMNRTLFTITNTESVWANFKIFPRQRLHDLHHAQVEVNTAYSDQGYTGKISNISVTADRHQAVTARVVLNNPDHQLSPGMFVTGVITTAHYQTPLAVKRSGLQSFRDFTVVYAQFGDQYEVRMLELGRQDDEWVEVLGGLDAGIRYVSTNSYLVKADIEKSAASHDH